MSLKKDKKKVVGESFSDERIKTFLDLIPAEGINADFNVLEKSYRGMIPENFTSFVGFFIEAGRDINARNPAGQTLLDIASEHRHGQEYVTALKKAAAQ